MAQRAPRSRVRKTSDLVATKPACRPLKDMYGQAAQRLPKTWGEIEPGFLRAMELFDANIAAGEADGGIIRNGKGDFFNDLLALLLENCAEIDLFSRQGVPGLIMRTHNLDVTYPPEGLAQFLLEAKAAGVPKHPGNPSQDNPLGRGGGADIDKRVKESAFKTIDLKAEHGRRRAMEGTSPTGGPGGNLTTWLRSVGPVAYLFMAIRVVGDTDRARVLRFADAAAQVFDHVGLFMYKPVDVSAPTTYRAVQTPDHLQLERVLFNACQDLVSMRAD